MGKVSFDLGFKHEVGLYAARKNRGFGRKKHELYVPTKYTKGEKCNKIANAPMDI